MLGVVSKLPVGGFTEKRDPTLYNDKRNRREKFVVSQENQPEDKEITKQEKPDPPPAQLFYTLNKKRNELINIPEQFSLPRLLF